MKWLSLIFPVIASFYMIYDTRKYFPNDPIWGKFFSSNWPGLILLPSLLMILCIAFLWYLP